MKTLTEVCLEKLAESYDQYGNPVQQSHALRNTAVAGAALGGAAYAFHKKFPQVTSPLLNKVKGAFKSHEEKAKTAADLDNMHMGNHIDALNAVKRAAGKKMDATAKARHVKNLEDAINHFSGAGAHHPFAEQTVADSRELLDHIVKHL